jgi:NTE family protein
MRRTTTDGTRRVALVLRGGGAHGAFTRGVLDRLLEDPRLAIEAASGASAGAMNAVVMAHGLASGGRDGAREALQRFWDAVAARGAAADPMMPAPLRQAWLTWARGFTPAQLNPLRLDPLRDILVEQIDFERLRAAAPLRLFVAATEVAGMRLRTFENAELTVEALLASACVPKLHHPVVIDGKAYWDGGLAANPPLYALVQRCEAADVVAVLLHPWRGPLAPAHADGIEHRLAEIGFASTLLSQLHGIALAQQAVVAGPRGGSPLERRLRGLRLHLIEDEALMRRLDARSRMDTRRTFLHDLRDRGRLQADRWLATTPARRARPRDAALRRFLPEEALAFAA